MILGLVGNMIAAGGAADPYGTNIVTNGDFSVNTGWTDSSTGAGTGFTIAGGTLEIFPPPNNTSEKSQASQAMTTEAGATYRVDYRELSGMSRNGVDVLGSGHAIRIGTGPGVGDISGRIADTIPTTFVATGTTTYITLSHDGISSPMQYDDVSVRKVL